MKRLAISLPALLAAWPCSACLASTHGNLDQNPGWRDPSTWRQLAGKPQPRAIE
jgi:hypothetical protein